MRGAEPHTMKVITALFAASLTSSVVAILFKMSISMIMKCVKFVSYVIMSCSLVERKRRDKINTWIVQLTKMIPEPMLDTSKVSS